MKRISSIDYLTIVTLSEAKAHLRVTHADDDAYITSLISAACEHVESQGQFWLGQDVQGELHLNAWPRYNSDGECIIYIPLANVTSIDTVQYIPKDSTELTSFDDHEATINSSPAQVYVLSTPSLGTKRDGIKITFKAGYESTPLKIKQAILIAIGNMFEVRQEEIIGTVLSKSASVTIDTLIRSHKLYMP